jgi:hypothetical protein
MSLVKDATDVTGLTGEVVCRTPTPAALAESAVVPAAATPPPVQSGGDDSLLENARNMMFLCVGLVVALMVVCTFGCAAWVEIQARKKLKSGKPEPVHLSRAEVRSRHLSLDSSRRVSLCRPLSLPHRLSPPPPQLFRGGLSQAEHKFIETVGGVMKLLRGVREEVELELGLGEEGTCLGASLSYFDRPTSHAPADPPRHLTVAHGMLRTRAGMVSLKASRSSAENLVELLLQQGSPESQPEPERLTPVEQPLPTSARASVEVRGGSTVQRNDGFGPTQNNAGLAQTFASYPLLALSKRATVVWGVGLHSR